MRTYIILSLSLLCGNLSAQLFAPDSVHFQRERKLAQGLRSKVDSIIDKNRLMLNDTDYVIRPKTPWTFRAKTDLYGHEIVLKNPETDDYRLMTLCKATVGLTANYRGVSLTLAFNPQKLFKKTSDIEYNLNYYYNRFGLDLQATQISSFKERVGDIRYNLADAQLRSLSVNGYYVFNHRRFSYGAAFCQSKIQKRSAGSPLVSLTGYVSQTKINNAPNMPLLGEHPLRELGLSFIALGAGYAYNFVPRGGHWLCHISTVPSLTVWKKSKAICGDNVTPTEDRPFNFYLTGRLGTTYSWSNYFAGINGVVQLYEAGKIEGTRIEHVKFKGRFYLGMRF